MIWNLGKYGLLVFESLHDLPPHVYNFSIPFLLRWPICPPWNTFYPASVGLSSTTRPILVLMYSSTWLWRALQLLNEGLTAGSYGAPIWHSSRARAPRLHGKAMDWESSRSEPCLNRKLAPSWCHKAPAEKSNSDVLRQLVRTSPTTWPRCRQRHRHRML